MAILVAILDFSKPDMIYFYSTVFLVPEDIYFDTQIMKIGPLLTDVQSCLWSEAVLAAILDFTKPDVIYFYSIVFLAPENIYFDTKIMKIVPLFTEI